MKMLMLVYSGPTPEQIARLLDAHHVGGYTQFAGVHGAGQTGRRDGSRAWPGESTLFVTVVTSERSPSLENALRAEVARLVPGERLHVAVLPTESFF